MCNDYCGNQNLKASRDLLVHGLCIFKHKFRSFRDHKFFITTIQMRHEITMYDTLTIF